MTKTIEVEIVEKADWDESLHPRDEHGRFGSGGGGGAKPAGGAKPGSRGFAAPSLESAQTKLRNPKGVKSDAVVSDIQAARDKVYALHRASREAGTVSSGSTSRFNEVIGDLHEAETMAASLPDTIHGEAPMSRETKDTLTLLSHRLAGIDMEIAEFEEKAARTPHAELEPGYLARTQREVGPTPPTSPVATASMSTAPTAERSSAIERLGAKSRQTPGGQLVAEPRFEKLKPKDRARVERVMAAHKLGPLKGSGNDRDDFKEFNVKQTMRAVRDAYMEGNGAAGGHRDPRSIIRDADAAAKDINTVHLRFDTTEERGSDQLDFKEHHVEAVREALTSAYLKGSWDSKGPMPQFATSYGAKGSRKKK